MVHQLVDFVVGGPKICRHALRPVEVRQRSVRVSVACDLDGFACVDNRFAGARVEHGDGEVVPDGTIKWLFDVGGGNAVETVFIPEVDRGTLCVSSQAGMRALYWGSGLLILFLTNFRLLTARK